MDETIRDIFLAEASGRCGLSHEQLLQRTESIEAFRLSLPQLCIWEQQIDSSLIERWEDVSFEVRLHLIVEAELMLREKRYLCEYNQNHPTYEPGVGCKVCHRFMVDEQGEPVE